MPWFRLRRARRYTVSSKNSYVVCVNLLDNTLIECTLTANSTGQECLENIAQRIELNEVCGASHARMPLRMYCPPFLFSSVYDGMSFYAVYMSGFGFGDAQVELQCLSVFIFMSPSVMCFPSHRRMGDMFSIPRHCQSDEWR